MDLLGGMDGWAEFISIFIHNSDYMFRNEEPAALDEPSNC